MKFADLCAYEPVAICPQEVVFKNRFGKSNWNLLLFRLADSGQLTSKTGNPLSGKC